MDTIENQARAIENQARSFFDDVRNKIPKLGRITFEIADYGEHVGFTGFIHTDRGMCENYRSVDELKAIIAEREILFRKF